MPGRAKLTAAAERNRRVAARSAFGSLRDIAVRPKTLSRYVLAVSFFYSWAHDNFPLVGQDWESLDRQLCAWIEHCWQEGENKALPADTVSGVQHLLMKRHVFFGAWKLIGIWSKQELPARAPPMPLLVLLALSGYANRVKRKDIALMLLIGYHSFLRTTEMLSICVRDFWLDRGTCTGTLCLPVTKSGARSGAPEMVTLDDPELGKRIINFCASLPTSALVCNIGYIEFRAFFAEAMAHLRVEHLLLRPYSIRRGGASFDFLTFGSLERTISRGRWASIKTAKIYINEGWSQLVNLTIVPLLAKHLSSFAQFA